MYITTHRGAVIAGVDEAGRGPWAGPVIASAVILDIERIPYDLCSSLDDSKKLSATRRAVLFRALYKCGAATIGVGQASVKEIDANNILNATHLAMARAIEQIGHKVNLALVDGNVEPPLPCDVTTVVKGDSKSLSIAAASVVAKVTRDRLMAELATVCPGYGWETNMGYGTKKHQDAISRLGITAYHRRSFAPIKTAMNSAAV